MDDLKEITVLGSSLAARSRYKEGLYDDVYAIPIIDKNKKLRNLEDIFHSVDTFIKFVVHAKNFSPNMRFNISFIGAGLDKTKMEYIASFFFPCKHLSNTTLPEEYLKIINKMYVRPSTKQEKIIAK